METALENAVETKVRGRPFVKGNPGGPGRPAGVSNWQTKFHEAVKHFSAEKMKLQNGKPWCMFHEIMELCFKGEPEGQFGPTYGLLAKLFPYIFTRLGIEALEPTSMTMNVQNNIFTAPEVEDARAQAMKYMEENFASPLRKESSDAS